MKNERHLLLMRFSALGDVAMTVPVVHTLATTYPDLRITMMSRAFARPFFENMAPNVSFMAADFKKEHQGWGGLRRLYRQLRQQDFTDVADLHDVLRTKYLRMRMVCDGMRVRHIDKHRRLRKKLTSRQRKERIELPSSFQNYADVLAALGYPVSPSFRSIYGNGAGDLHLLPAAIGNKKEGEKWMGIAPFAAHRGKIYPLDKMEKVIEAFQKHHPRVRIFLFGGGDKEKNILDEWCQRFSTCTNASAVLGGLTRELILMSNLDVMLSMDSANAHLASLTGIRVVSVWGATHPCAGFMAWNQQAEDAVQVELPCRPCSIYGNKPCHRHDFACMETLDPERITDRLMQVLEL